MLFRSIAAQVSKDKDFFQSWIESTAALLQDIYYAGIAPERIGQYDLLKRMEELAKSVPHSRLVRIISAVGKLNRDLQYNVNRQLALESMFVTLQTEPG